MMHVHNYIQLLELSSHHLRNKSISCLSIIIFCHATGVYFHMKSSLLIFCRFSERPVWYIRNLFLLWWNYYDVLFCVILLQLCHSYLSSPEEPKRNEYKKSTYLIMLPYYHLYITCIMVYHFLKLLDLLCSSPSHQFWVLLSKIMARHVDYCKYFSLCIVFFSFPILKFLK